MILLYTRPVSLPSKSSSFAAYLTSACLSSPRPREGVALASDLPQVCEYSLGAASEIPLPESPFSKDLSYCFNCLFSFFSFLFFSFVFSILFLFPSSSLFACTCNEFFTDMLEMAFLFCTSSYTFMGKF